MAAVEAALRRGSSSAGYSRRRSRSLFSFSWSQRAALEPGRVACSETGNLRGPRVPRSTAGRSMKL